MFEGLTWWNTVRSVAAELGVPPGPPLVARFGEVVVELDGGWGGLEIRARARGTPMTLDIRRRGRPADEAPTGDATFDEAVEVTGASPAALLARMDAALRRDVELLVADGASLAGGIWALPVRSARAPALVDRMRELAVAAGRLGASRAGVPALLERAAGDPLPEVRARALALALEEGAPEAGLLALAGRDDPATALTAAVACGEAGRPHLLRVVRSRRVEAADAALALARLPRGPEGDEVEAFLRELLDEGRREAIDALGRIGTAASVPRLREIAGRALLGPEVARAKRALADIRARLGDKAGGLALADLGGGELADPDP